MTAVGLTWFFCDLAWIYQPLPYTIGILFGSAYKPVLAHLAIVFPAGVLRRRIDRVVVWLTYGLWLMLSLATLAFWDPKVDCPVACSTSLSLVDPDRHLHDGIESTGAGVGVLMTLIIAGLVKQHWLVARTPARRALDLVLWSTWPMSGSRRRCTWKVPAAAAREHGLDGASRRMTVRFIADGLSATNDDHRRVLAVLRYFAAIRKRSVRLSGSVAINPH